MESKWLTESSYPEGMYNHYYPVLSFDFRKVAQFSESYIRTLASSITNYIRKGQAEDADKFTRYEVSWVEKALVLLKQCYCCQLPQHTGTAVHFLE